MQKAIEAKKKKKKKKSNKIIELRKYITCDTETNSVPMSSMGTPSIP
jgi:hypothetical protein